MLPCFVYCVSIILSCTLCTNTYVLRTATPLSLSTYVHIPMNTSTRRLRTPTHYVPPSLAMVITALSGDITASDSVDVSSSSIVSSPSTTAVERMVMLIQALVSPLIRDRLPSNAS